MHRILRLPVFICFFSAASLFAQNDALYLKNKNKKIGRVTEIASSRIEFQEDADGKTRKIDKSDLELILFSNGSYLTFPSDYKGMEGPAENRHSDDWLLTKGKTIVPCRIENGESNPMKISLPEKAERSFEVPKSEITAILFANGRKQLLGADPALIADILRNKQMQSGAEFLAPFEQQKTAAAGEKKFEGKLAIDDAGKEQMKQRGILKTKDLEKYLNLIANRATQTADAAKAVDQAVTLFLSDSSQVETKRQNGERRQEFIRNYLTRLRLLKYSRVDVEWSDIAYVSNLRKAPDGNYYGVISIQQRFTGYMDNKPVFSDVTRKNIEIVLKTYRKDVDGESVDLWDVFLNNIGIADSKG